ncbi:class C sortase [Demequina pelophila]|uniref:class C sortase n=1 Tax=Demequina pelophila TaxID=1638984 RepID=UPI0007818939|nr:class C sortase [Demequina pelophila]
MAPTPVPTNDAAPATDAGAPAARAATASSPAKRRLPVRGILVAVLILVGIGTLAYPTIASMWNSYRQSTAVAGYADAVENTDAAERAAELQRAHDYNAALPPMTMADPFSSVGTAADPETQARMDEYRGVLAITDAMARIRIPSIGVDLPIYHGSGEDALQRGVGHLFGTHLPVGGEGTRAVLTGHRGLPDAMLFTHVDRIVPGDKIYVDVLGETFTYEVDGTQTVLPEDGELLDAVEGQDLLSLVTCTPIGINTHRLIVTGHRIPTVAEDAAPATSTASIVDNAVTTLPWWAVGALVGAWMLLMLILLLRRRRRDRRG